MKCLNGSEDVAQPEPFQARDEAVCVSVAAQESRMAAAQGNRHQR